MMQLLPKSQEHAAWMDSIDDHLFIAIKVGATQVFEDILIQAITENGIIKIFVNDKQVAESDGKVVKYG